MRKWQLSSLVLAIGAGASGFAACVSNSNEGPGPGVDGSAPEIDGSTFSPDAPASSPDAPANGDDAGLGASDGGAIQDSSFVDVLAPTSWALVDTTTLDAGLAPFSGATFDGRYAYFAPNSRNGSVVGRLDTQQDFRSPSAWESFATLSVLPGAGAYTGAVFDGQYVYFVPFNNNLSKVPDAFDQTFVRYDTHADFATGTSWTQFDGSDVAGGPFWGGTFDGRYVYFTSYFSSTVAWYDTHGSFTSDAAWGGLNTANLSPPASAPLGQPVFAGSVFDGKYVYFIGPVVARHDTTALPDAGAASWETYVVAGDAGPSILYQAGAFDGRYLYLANRTNDVVARYDTQASFSASSSWTTFDVSTAGGDGSGFNVMNFDGRHLYLAPSKSTIAMLDTQAPFQSASSWTTFDAATLVTVPNGYETLLFDGQYLYAGANATSPLLRLEVKSAPSALPNLPLFHGSFF